MKRLFLLFLVSSLLSSCLPRTAPLRVEPKVDIIPLVFSLQPEATIIESFDPPGAGSQLDLKLGILVKNPNSFAINLRKLNYQLALAGTRIETNELEPNYYIRAYGEVPISIQVKASVEGKSKLIKAIARAFTGVNIDFSLDGQTVFESLTHEFKSSPETLVSGKIAVRNEVLLPLMSVNTVETSVYLLRADAPVIKVNIWAQNPGEVGYFIYGQEVNLNLDGEILMSQDIALNALPANQVTNIEIFFYPDMDYISESLKGKINAALAGTAIAFSLTGDILIDVLGIDTYRAADGWNVYGTVSKPNSSP